MPESETAGRVAGEDREDRSMVHVHTFNTITLVADGHQHLVQGATGPARLAGMSHIHRIRVRTSYFDCHWHWFDVMSGPAIDTMDGGHVHNYAGETSFDDGHTHDVVDTTALGPNLPEEEEVEEPRPPVHSAKPKAKVSKRGG